MASSSLALYKNDAATNTFLLVSTSKDGASYMMAGRDIATPYVVEIKRKLTAPNATANDHIQVRIARTERNATTGKLATAQCLLDLSIPKDTSVLTAEVSEDLICCLGSLLRDNGAMTSAQTNVTALVAGFDL